MPRYADERKAAVLNKLLPPHNRPVPEIAQTEGISEATLYNWVKQAREEGIAVPGSGKASPESWGGEAKFAVVLETVGMNASEVGEYCRRKGLYPDQVARWKQACIAGAGTGEQTGSDSLKHARKQIRQLEKDLRRKEKALAESAALLILQIPARGTRKVQCAVGGRGMMATPQQRETVVNLVDEAVTAGARRSPACQVVGINVRTLQRWHRSGETQVRVDQRPLAKRPEPPNKLSEPERQELLEVCNQPEYANLPPSQIVPKLADAGRYVASESTFYRTLKANNQLHHRGHAKAPQKKREPATHTATAPNQVWTWDVTWLPSTVTGRFFYLYLVEDLYSRYGIVWEVHERESGELAAELLEKAVWREKLHGKAKPVLHNDNGSIIPMGHK